VLVLVPHCIAPLPTSEMLVCLIYARSLLSVETADRPGLLLEILKVICDISIYVESAEIDTEVSLVNGIFFYYIISLC